MADDRPADNAPRAAHDDRGDRHAAPERQPPNWADLWQVPTIALSLLLIGAGIFLAVNRATTEDFGSLLARAEAHLESNAIGRAGEMIREELDPILDTATPEQRGRFHMLLADWIALTQEAEDVELVHNNQRIAEQYTAGVDLGRIPTAEQLERWANALIALNRHDRARDTLEQLERIAEREQTNEAEERRMRVFKRLINAQIRDAEAPTDPIIALLRRYREHIELKAPDLAWAVARLAEIRLLNDQPRRTVEQLLIDLRRIEYRIGDGPSPELGELYTLLGRAYFMLGEDTKAQFNLERGLKMFDADVPARGDALVTLGQVAQAQNDLDEAFEHFDIVVRDFIATPSYLPGLLGRAETNSVLGDHEASINDYTEIARQLAEGRGDRIVTPITTARSLTQRHDATLATGKLDLAFSYIRVAEQLFSTGSVPIDVLHRLANTSRQYADNLVADADRGSDGRVLDMEVRYEANRLHEQAGEYYTRHARKLAASPSEDDDWAESLWYAAECFDLAGLHEQAIKYFEEYLAGRSREDPRRADVNFRLAQSRHALMHYEKAAQHYEQVIHEHPRSITATRSYVPLSRCYLALDRRSEAEVKLTRVVAGVLPIEPDSTDYRNALIELGTLHYHNNEYLPAIERLTEAIDRYPDDRRSVDTLYKLADSHRSRAIVLADRIREPSTESPGERRRLDEKRREHLRTAQVMFNDIAETYELQEQRRLDELDRERLRLAYLYRADCAYHLGRYEEAIAMYDQAARRYADHHSSMHALVQIVNAYSELGDSEAAQAAHRRALVRLERLRDEAFEEPGVIMDRQAWERWLEHAPIERTHAASAAMP